jgi:hypothetical protein
MVVKEGEKKRGKRRGEISESFGEKRRSAANATLEGRKSELERF